MSFASMRILTKSVTASNNSDQLKLVIQARKPSFVKIARSLMNYIIHFSTKWLILTSPNRNTRPSMAYMITKTKAIWNS